MLAAALGITAVVVRIPHALTLLAAGALYLAGWPGSRCGRAGVRRLTSSRVNAVQSRRLLMGATTSLLNQADDDFVSLVPRFVDYRRAMYWRRP
jgi:threonine/homoserine/homoserine lactone efflux protein